MKISMDVATEQQVDRLLSLLERLVVVLERLAEAATAPGGQGCR